MCDYYGNESKQIIDDREKDSILYISDSEKDMRIFLEYLKKKMDNNGKECFLDGEHDILKQKITMLSVKVFMVLYLESDMGIVYITVFREILIRVSATIWKNARRKKFLRTQERVQKKYRNLIFYAC